LTPKSCLGRSEILWVVSASIFLLVARCLSHEAEPHTFGSNGFQKRTHAAYGLGGAKSHTSGEGWIWGDWFSAGALLFPLAFFFAGHEGTFGVLCRYLVAASLEVPPLCSSEAMFHLFCSVGDIAILFGPVVGTVGRL